MASTCWAPVRGKVVRLTKVDGCGNPVMCPDGTTPIFGVSDGVVSVQIEPEVDEGEDITATNFNGDSCVDIPACPHIRWLNLTIDFCRIDPELFALATSVPVVRNPDGTASGFRVGQNISCDEGFALEIWTGSGGGNRCSGTSTATQYGYLLIPWVQAGILGSYTIENGAVTFEITAKGVAGGNWGVGPYDVYQDATGAVKSKLVDPIGPTDLQHIDVTTMPPPSPTCGLNCAVTQPNPTVTVVSSPTDATGMTARVTYDNAPNGAVTVDWGDGTPLATFTAEQGIVSHQYLTAGTKNIKVTDANFPTATTTKPFTAPTLP